MKISETIKKLEDLKNEHGDIDVMTFEGDSVFLIEHINVFEVEDDGDFPADWEMPAGFKFVNVESFS